MGKFIDLTGQRFGKLTVVSRSENNKNGQRYWNCSCDCGNTSIVYTGNLKRGHTKSCGCLSRACEDLTGQRFGELVVVSRSHGVRKGIYWDCACSCGKKLIVESHRLRVKAKSCGCISNNLLDKSLSSKRGIYYRYWKGAKDRDLSFSLSFDDVLGVVQQDCFYCGEKPYICFKTTDARQGFTCNGIDRLDNTIGYEKGNIVPCCKQCNKAKLKRNKEDFISWIKRSYLHRVI